MKKLTVETLTEIGQLSAKEWDGLGFENPFLKHAFLVSLEDAECVGEGTAWFPAIVTARLDGELVGGLPLYVKMDSAGEFVFDWGWADAAQRAGIAYYPKAIVAVPFTPVTGDRILVSKTVDNPDDIAQALVQAAIEIAKSAGFSSVHFNFFEERNVTLFDDLPLRFGTQYHWYNQDEGGQPLTHFDGFLARFRSKRRANIRRERRKLVEMGVTTRVLRGDDIKADDMRRMFRYYLSTVHKFYWGHQYLNEEFFLMLGRRFGDNLHLVVTELDGVPFGGTFNVVSDNRLFGRYWGCDQQVPYAHFETCMYKPIEWCIENNIDVFEPGAGGEHKFERGFTPTKTYSAHWIAHPELRNAVEHALVDERQYVDERNEHLQAASPLKSTKSEG